MNHTLSAEEARSASDVVPSFRSLFSLRSVSYGADFFIVLVLAIRTFFALLTASTGDAGDYEAHVKVAEELFSGGHWPVHFLYHLTTRALSSFYPGPFGIVLASLIVLTVSVLVKYLLTRNALVYFSGSCDRRTWMIASGFALMILLAMPIKFGSFSAGFLGPRPNVWHNPTQIVAMPFAMVLFLVGGVHLRSPATGRLPALCVIVVLNLIAKPSYVLPFIPGFSIMFLSMHGWRKFFIQCLPVLLTAAVGICIQSIVLYYMGDGENRHQIVIRPFYVWQTRTTSIPINFLASTAFPLLALLLPQPKVSPERRLAWLAYCFGLLAYAIFVEDGSRELHGNFGWLTVPTLYFVYLMAGADLLRTVMRTQVPVLPWLLLGVLIFQTIIGLVAIFTNPQNLHTLILPQS